MTKLAFEVMDSVAFAGGEAGTITVDTTKLPANVLGYIFGYGLKQMLNDVHAGETAKKTADEKTRVANKQALVAKKLASLYAGEVAQARTAGDPVEREMLAMAEAELKGKIKAIGKKVGDFKPEVWKDAVAKHVKAGEARFRAAAIAKLAIKVEEVDFDLDSLLGEEAPTGDETPPTE